MERNVESLAVCFVLSICMGLPAFAEILPADRTTLGKIEAAVERGELPYDYAVTYKYLALFSDAEHLVPSRYQGERLGSAPWVSGTLVILELGRAYPSLRPELKALLEERCGIAGADDGALYGANGYRVIGNGDSSYGGYGVHTYDTPEGNFKVHYVLEGPDALEDTTDSDGNGIYDIVEWYGEDYELVFGLATGVDRYGFHSKGNYWMLGAPGYEDYMPLRDYYPYLDGGWPDYDGPGSEYGSDFGGDERWDIYIIGDFEPGGGGAVYMDQAFPFTSWYDYTGYFAVPGEYYGEHLNPDSDGGWNTTVLSAHHFAHLMQFMHDGLESSPGSRGSARWYLEATAGYFEYTCFGAVDSFFAWAGNYLEDPLNSVEDPGDGGYLLNIFLEDWSERGPIGQSINPNKVVPEIWRVLTGPGDPWYTGDLDTNRETKEAIGFLVDEYNTEEVYVEGRAFKDTYEVFTKWNWFTGARDDGNHYVFGPQLTTVIPSRTHDTYPVAEPSGVPFLIDHLGSAYFLFENLPEWGAGVLIYEASGGNPDNSRDWAGHICALKGGTWQSLEGEPGEWSDMLSPKDIGIIQIPGPDRFDGFVFCLANTSFTGYDLDYAYYFSETTDVDPPTVTMAPVRTDTNPDYVEVLIGSDEELFGVPAVYGTYTPKGEDSTKVEVEMTDEGGGGASFTGTVVLPIGFTGTGAVEYAAADLGGNIVSGSKQFSAGTLAAGGGTVGAEGAYLRAPSGAFSAPTLVTIFEGETYEETSEATELTTEGTMTSKALAAEETMETVGTSYLYGPEWANLGAPVSVILSYDGLDVTKEDYLSIYQWNGSGWTDLGGTIDEAHRRVTADANSLGTFILGYGDKKEGDDGGFIPSSYALYQSYPNPAGASAKVKYALPEDGHVSIKLYNIAGQVVKVLVDEEMAAGTHIEPISTDDMANGVYLYRMEASDYSAVMKMVVTR